MDNTSDYSTRSVFKRLLEFVKPYRMMVFGCCTASLVNGFADIIMAYLIKNLVDSTLDRLYEQLLKNVLLVCVVTIFGVVAKFIVRFLSERIGIYTLRDIRKAITKHISAMKLESATKHHSGDTVSRFINNTGIVRGFLENQLYQFIYQPVIFIGAFIYMLLINWKLLLVNIVIMVIVMFITIILSNPLEKKVYELQRYMGEVNAIALDVLAGISVMKAFNLLRLLSERYGEAVNKALYKNLEISKQMALMSPALVVLEILPMTISILYGGYLTIKGDLIPSDLIVNIYLLEYLTEPVIVILSLTFGLKTTIGAAAGIFEVLDSPVERVSGCYADGNTGNGMIEFKNVTFSYDGETPVLEQLSFSVLEGKKVAIVGASGSGKSTVFKLLCGLYEPQTGEIALNGCPISTLDLEFVRSQFSVVSQDVYLYPISIAENIALGKTGASLDEVITAAKIANAHSFILGLPQGYHTIVGERGAGLSGGQRQRISIARAVLKDAPIMLLDEATSALDNQSEAIIQEALERLMNKRTVVIIAHRLSTIKNVDEIIVLGNGMKIEQGSHEQLMLKRGLYSELYNRQFFTEMQVLEKKESLC